MKKVLIVDDNEAILDAFRALLSYFDFEVHTVMQGEATLETALAQKPDVILLDVLLSGTDGKTICIQLKGETMTRHIPVIMMSAHPDGEVIAAESGANGFVAKPVSIKDILSAIDKVVPPDIPRDHASVLTI